MEMEEIFDKLQAVADRYDELNELISDPEVIADSQRFMKLSKEEGAYAKPLKNTTSTRKSPKRLRMTPRCCAKKATPTWWK